jgi:hypothetical protein
MGCSLLETKSVIHVCGADRPATLRERLSQWRAERRLIRRKRRARIMYGITSWIGERVTGWHYTLNGARERYEEEME